MQKKTFKSDLLLFLAAFIWGTAFVAQRRGMEHVGPMIFTGLRFLLGATALSPIIIYLGSKGAFADQNFRKIIPLSILAGLVLFAGAALQQVGLVTTTAGKAGFITGLYITIVPFLGLLLGHRIGWSTWLGCFLAFAGMYLLSAEENFVIQTGDLYVLAGAFFWAVHVQLIGYLAKSFNPLPIAFFQFIACGIAGLLLAFFVEDTSIQSVKLASGSIFYGGVMSVGIAFTLQVVSQRTCPPAHAAIIMSMEMAIAALAGWLVLNEVLDAMDISGCLLMLAGVLVVQLVPILKKRIRAKDKALYIS